MQTKKLWIVNYQVRLKRVRGSFTVEAAIVVPIILFSILWMIESSITLYSGTVELVRQMAWEGFDPAAEFRKLELLENLLETAKSGT